MSSVLLDRYSPDLELERLAALHEYNLLDSPADDELSAVVRVAAMVADVPTVTLNLIDENRQCQLTTVGFAGSDSARSDSMCAVQFRKGKLVHVPDARQHPLYADNPWVDGRLHTVRFYASAPLITPTGHALGTLCVFDTVPKQLSDEQLSRLEDLAAILVGLFERRHQARLNAELAAEAERSHKFIETLLDTVDVGIAAADSGGRLTLINRAVRRWAGVTDDQGTPADMLPMRYTLLQPDARTPVPVDQTPLCRALRDDVVTDTEMVVRTADGNLVTVTVNARSMIADNGRRIGAVVALNDVTSDRHHRRQLEQAHAELAEREEQLAGAVTELRRSNDELEAFAAAVSHDLVGPLSSASGYLGLFQQMYGQTVDARGAKWLDGATRAIDRMQQLVRSLLDYARAGHAPCRAVPVDLHDLMAQVATDLRTLIESNGAEIVVKDALPAVTGDSTLLRQLLQNLVDNSIKYRRPDRPPRIELDCTTEGDGGWCVTITDNGMGIPAEHRDRIFDMFAQVDPVARKGYGIGLSTCLQIVERHRGRITVGDSPGGGAVVRLHLPGQPALAE